MCKQRFISFHYINVITIKMFSVHELSNFTNYTCLSIEMLCREICNTERRDKIFIRLFVYKRKILIKKCNHFVQFYCIIKYRRTFAYKSDLHMLHNYLAFAVMIVSSGKASTLLTILLLVIRSILTLPRKRGSKETTHISFTCLVGWLYFGHFL